MSDPYPPPPPEGTPPSQPPESSPPPAAFPPPVSGGTPPPPPAPPPAYAPAAYGQPPAAAGGYAAQVPRTSSNAVVALVLAIAAWVVCPIVPAIVALPVASSAQREIDASGGWVTGTGMVQAARIIAWVNIALLGLVAVIFLILIVVAGVSGSN